MPWVRAKLRGQLIYARADAAGNLTAEGGRVEIRYKPNDGRMYRAAPGNLSVQPGEVLPDDACGPAEAVGKKKASKKKAAAKPAPVPEGAIVAYTDGACSGNPGPAGLGVVVLQNGERIERWEYLGKATNNIAELTAILRALEEIPAGSPCVVHTDSQYAIGVLQKGWKAKKNKELVAELRATLANHDCRLVYVKGHAGIPLNERADELARLAVEIRGSGRETRKTSS
ncbi:MAG TPA: ribonuclease HI [Polyangiaceae bacterium]|nr:ribonuclease HI [Polyangiaceae bacterium]